MRAATPSAARVTRAAAGLLCGLLLFTACGAFKRFNYEGFGRDGWQQPERVVTELGLRPGDRVADIGAGGGYFTFRLAEAVGATGRVYAVDVDESMTSHIAQRAREEGHAQVEAVLAEPDDPGLPDGSIDLVFTCNTYHHLGDRKAYFRAVRRDLRAGARVAILEFNGNSWLARIGGHYTPAAQIRAEMEEAGYRLQRELDFVDRQSFTIFRVE